MKLNAKTMFVTATFALLMGLLPSVASAQTRNFAVINDSSYRINHIYVSPASYDRWGYDRLGDRVLLPDYRFDLAVYPGWYDVKLIDEAGRSCELDNLDFRSGDTWTLTDGLLAVCDLVSH